jgi:hypothetical protein
MLLKLLHLVKDESLPSWFQLDRSEGRLRLRYAILLTEDAGDAGKSMISTTFSSEDRTVFRRCFGVDKFLLWMAIFTGIETTLAF